MRGLLTGVALADTAESAVEADILWDIAPLYSLRHDVEALVATLAKRTARSVP